MKNYSNKASWALSLILILLTLFFLSACDKDDDVDNSGDQTSSLTPDSDNGGLTLPTGFGGITVSAQTGAARHIAVNTNGDIFIKLSELKGGNGILVLKDADNDGKADSETGFGNYTGTGIALKDGYLYASSDNEVFRYKFNSNNEIENASAPEKIITGLTKGSQHSSKSIALDNQQNIYVNIGAPSNACQVQDRTPGSPGQDPCPILETAGGIWQFKADQLNQSQSQGIRYATGLRNVVGLDWNTSSNDLYVMQHGRDQLSFLFPDLFTDSMSAELPAEEFFRVKQGSDFGWPYCYYDQIQNKKVLAPEYGGNGQTTGRCDGVEKPILAFPGHWAPNSLLFYTGDQFPDRYKNGAFIAFHGSWNRAPLRQGGYFVVFVPMNNGLPSGAWEMFAEGFPGIETIAEPDQAQHRPMGLAQGPDGSLYISDSKKGKIWRIIYKG
ncbi:MAG TPA: PQQ-dependent sugar dehydrogenase [Chitinophagaceae bacterium]|nr:PQQ-dependent sugar dehydrogenase [Chitinophagaceae bacterium]